MKKKIVLITGVAGFIGSHAADKFLSKGFEVRGVDNFSSGNKENIKHLKNNKKFKFLRADILNLKKNKFINDCNYVLHFAGLGDIVPSIKYPLKYFENNFSGTINLLEIINKKKLIKFVYAASSTCYGLAKTPTGENHKIDPKYPYALSKYFGEQVCFHWHKVYKVPVNSIRIFNAYGTRSRTTGAYGAVIGVFLKQKIMKHPLTVVGNGKQKRDFLYVTDVVEAFYKAALTKLNGKIWNIGSDDPKSINYLCKLLGEKKIIKIPKRPKEPNITFAETSKIKKDLNWQPKVKFEKGIKIILSNIDYWKNSTLWTKNKINIATKDWFKYLK